MAVPNVTMNNGVTIPQLGFGTFQVAADETAKAVRTALEIGYRHLDTAAVYGNEEGVGRAIADSGIAREELFVTTKLGNGEQGYDRTLRAFDASLARLGLDFVDLYLIHWPQPARDLYVDTWRAFEKLAADGRVRTIGVSNFQSEHLDRLAAESDVVPAVNQIELHPRLPQAELRELHAKRGIVTESWSPLAQGGDVLRDPTLSTLAEKYGKSSAQLILRWHLELGCVVIPKSVTPSRMRENFELFDFELADDDLSVFADLDTGTRVGPHPDEVN